MIFFCGDPHSYFAHIIEAVQEHRPDAVILLGDIQAQRPLEVESAPILALTEVWFIHGNHDTDSDADHDNLFGSRLRLGFEAYGVGLCGITDQAGQVVVTGRFDLAHARALNIDQSLHRLADYPVLAALAQGQTTATKLDGRACRFIYQAALHELEINRFSTRERQFFDALWLVKKC